MGVVLIEAEVLPDIIEIATPGPQGPSGNINPSYTTSTSLSGHQVISLNSSGLAEYASCDNINYMSKIVGISTGAATSGSSITIQSGDVMDYNGWSWTPNQIIFLGLNGSLVSSVPVSAVFTQVMGIALSSTSILVGIQQPIVI
jgi:hypothetical protein